MVHRAYVFATATSSAMITENLNGTESEFSDIALRAADSGATMVSDYRELAWMLTLH
jgi:hypothetical protein